MKQLTKYQQLNTQGRGHKRPQTTMTAKERMEVADAIRAARLQGYREATEVVKARWLKLTNFLFERKEVEPIYESAKLVKLVIMNARQLILMKKMFMLTDLLGKMFEREQEIAREDLDK